MFRIDTERDRLVTGKLTMQFKENIVGQEVMSDMLCTSVRKESVDAIMLFLRDDPELQYNFLTTLCGTHDPEKNELGVVYHLHSFDKNHRIRIKTVTPVDQPEIPTLTTVWPTANWMERETYDFYGIQFTGHPNLKRILNIDDMTGFPMRKDFPLEDQTRSDKDDSMFGR